jgi:serine/threonine protein kinase/Tol biopolymer transport system component
VSAASQIRQCVRCGGALPLTGALAGHCPSCLLEAGLEEGSGDPAGEEPPEGAGSLLPAGTQVGPYQIEVLLGAGGMSQVYRALDTRLGRKVAIKFLSGEVADAAGRRRFQREAQMASALNHPHIVTVYDVGEFADRQYLVTELIETGSLSDWARRQKRAPHEIVEVLAGVADALAAAHDANILHRDIKPPNILVTESGFAKLVDFGLAKLAESPKPGENPLAPAQATTRTEVTTRVGVIVGTIAYMSPEQAMGHPVDRRSDIFSFGIVLYELLAGRRPFAGQSDLELLQTIIHGAPHPLSEQVPPMLRMVVEKALENDPRDRYQSIGELAVDLRRFIKAKMADALPPPKRKLRHVWLPWSAAALLTATAIWELVRPPAAPPNLFEKAHFARVTDFESVEAAISPDGRFAAFLSDHDGPFDVWLTQVGTGHEINLTHGTVGQLPTPLRSVRFSSDGSEIAIGGADMGTRLQLMPLIGGAPRNFLAENAADVGWSPDGAHIAYHTYADGDPLFVADAAGSNPRQIFAGPPGIHNHFPTWSPDGRWIYFVNGTPATKELDLWRIPPGGGKPQRLTEMHTDIAYPTPVGPRTAVFVAHDADGSGPWLWALDLKQKASRRISFGLEQYTSVAGSADGHRLIATIASPKASLWSVPILNRVAEERDVKPFALPTVRALAPRYGGPALFYLSSLGTGDGLWRYRGGQALEIWKGAAGALLEPASVSADGTRVAIVLRRRGKRQLHVLSADGAEFQPIAGAIDVQGTGSWSPDRKWIVSGGSDPTGPGLFKIPLDGGPAVRLAAGPALNPVWSPDGSLIVYAGTNVRTFAPLLAVRPDGTSVKLPEIGLRRLGERVRFLPDGKSLVYMQGLSAAQDFWLLDLADMKSRLLTRLQNRATMRAFDITPDGKQIVFDRLRESSDVVLIDLPKE